MRRKIILFTILATIVVIAPYAARKVVRFIRQHIVAKHTQVAKQALSQKDQIRAVVKHNLHQIVDCYNQRIRSGLSRVGDLKIAWDIDERGNPSNFEEKENQLQDNDLYICSSQVISQWKFPHGIYFKVDYTFHLKQKPRNIDLSRNVASQEDLAEVDIE